MALPRVDAVQRSSPVQPVRPQGGGASPAQVPGSTLALSLQHACGDDLLALGPDGVPIRLPGLAHLTGQMGAGDTLLMRVVSAGPTLELALVESPARPQPGGPAGPQTGRPADPPAVQFDQLAFRHAARASGGATAESGPLPSQLAGTALAASWRVQVLGILLGPAAAAHEAAGNPPGSSVAPGALPASVPLVSPGAERWLFHLHTTLGLPMQLRLVDSESDDDPAASRAAQERAGAAVGLRLDLVLPHLGRIALRLRSVNGGVALILVLAQDGAVPPVRAALPGLALALVRARISLRSCRLLREPALGADRALPGELHANGPRIAAALPPALFRAAAETVLALVAADAALSP